MSDLFKSTASKRNFFFTVWKVVIYSKLASSIYERLASKPRHYEYSEAEQNLVGLVDKHESFMNLNFLFCKAKRF